MIQILQNRKKIIYEWITFREICVFPAVLRGTYISFHIFLQRKTFVIICPSEVAYTPNVDNFGKKNTIQTTDFFRFK